MNALRLRILLTSALLPPICGGTGDTTTTFTGALKYYYPAAGVVDISNTTTYLLSKVEKAKDFKFFGGVGGRGYWKSIQTALSGGTGPRAENGALPTPGSLSLTNLLVPDVYHYGVAQMSGPVMDLSEGDKNAFAAAVKLIMDSMFREFRRVKNTLIHGYGAGILGVVGSIASHVITLKDDIHPGAWFYVNQLLDSYTDDTQTTAHDTAIKVTAVDYVNRKVTVSGDSTTVANDVLVLSGVGTTASPMGLLGIDDDGTYVATYMGASRTTYPGLKSFVGVGSGQSVTKYGNAASARRPISEDLIQQMVDTQQTITGSDRPIDLLYSGLGVRRQYFLSLKGDRRYENNWVYDGGWRQLRFYNGDIELNWMASEFCPRYTLFGLYTGTKRAPEREKPAKIEDEEILALYQAPWGGAKWDDLTGSQFNRVYSSSNPVDAVVAILKDYFNFASCNPAAFARLDDILES